MRLARGVGVAAHTVAANGSGLGLPERDDREYPPVGVAGNGKPQLLDVLAPRAGRASSSTEGKRRSYDSSAPGRTIQVKPTTKGLDAVGEPAEP